ncbi:MAG: xanthine dehydrogenase accessory protein XdhC [Pseudomonadales bacterium]
MDCSWPLAVSRCAERGEPFVLATVLATSGSTPRSSGSKMVITASRTHDSIGGGQLEQLVIQRSREMLEEKHGGCEITHFPLAASAMQCCGGSMTVLLEALGMSALRLHIFGAGNVGRRVARLMRELDCSVTLIDARKEELAKAPKNITVRQHDDPPALLPAIAPGDHVLVMTHDHLLDYQLVKGLLKQGHGWTGLIGSETKWRRFRARLLADGLSEVRVNTVCCPVGRFPGSGKEPMAVAISIAAQLLELRPNHRTTNDLSWRQIRSSLLQYEETHLNDSSRAPSHTFLPQGVA